MNSTEKRNSISKRWFDYYQKEASYKCFRPESDKYEIHRTSFALQLRLGIDEKSKILSPLKLANRLRDDCSSVLEVGCGDGYLTDVLEQSKIYVTPTDISFPRLVRLNRRNSRISPIQSDLYNLPFEDNSFESVFSIEVIEHTEFPKEALAELKRVAAKFLIISVPYDRPLKTMTCPHCGENFYVDGHIQRFDPDRLKSLCDEVGIEIKLIRGYKIKADISSGSLRKRIFILLKRILRLYGFLKPLPYKYLGILGMINSEQQ